MITNKTKFKIISSIFLLILFVLLLWLLFSGGNFEIIKSVFTEELTRDEIRERLASLGYRGYITVTVLAMLQVVFTFLPAEPVQVISGIAFGFPIGLVCCTLGVLIGNTLIFILYKTFGNRLREYFVKNLHINFDKAASSKKLTAVIFILYFLPAIPYGMICFFAASLDMKYPRYITVTILGSIPSVCIGVGLGHIAISSSFIVSVIVFVAILILLAIVMIKRNAIFDKVNSYIDKPPYSSKTTVRKYSSLKLLVPYIVSRIVFFIKGVRVKYTNKVGNIDTPSIVLCNHGSFIDFAYAGTLLRKKSPNFIVARLYFYKKLVGKFLSSFGCFPKSMFAADLESAKNCLRVIRNNGVLAMMPEARLSTVGRFEDIQDGTYAFLKKSAVTVYSIKIEGDYFAKPKWADKLRRGSLVEAELDLLFTKEELDVLTADEIKARVEERLYYDEFEWIKKHEDIRYRSKRLAVGLENILTKCPKCKDKYTISTKGCDIFCKNCGNIATIDERYSFINSTPFKNFAEWYDWQKEELTEEINSNPNFVLTAPTELKLRSLDGKTMLRSAGHGVSKLDRNGLSYTGTKDGESFEIHFPLKDIYRLLFGAGEDFEIYVGQEIYYFVPRERCSAVDFYIASIILTDRAKLLI